MVHRVTPDRAAGRAHRADAPPVLSEQARTMVMDLHPDRHPGYTGDPLSSTEHKQLTGFCAPATQRDVLTAVDHRLVCDRDRNGKENFLCPRRDVEEDCHDRRT